MILGLAPMDGYTDCAFRQIVKEIFEIYGEKNKFELILRTEFMNADGYIINPPGVIKHLLTDKNQDKVIAQIFGGNEDMLTQCFVDIQNKYGKIEKLKDGNKSEFSFAGIELNMGCPARNVMNTGGGSALLKDKKNTLDIIKKLSGAMKIPLSIKTRTGINEEERKNQMKFLREASKYVSMISIHGRTVKQAYTGNVDREFIYELKNKVNKHCKIIGNGGIKSYEEAIDHIRGIYTSYSDFDFHESAEELKRRGLITDGKYLPYDPLLQERARELRKYMTSSEKQIWKYCLKPLGINILRQKVIDHYIVDFYIPSRKLVIEIDGDTHLTEEAKKYDKKRTNILESYGLEVLRITNDEVYNHFERICKIVEQRITPNPSLAKRGAVATSSFATEGNPAKSDKGGARRAEDSILDGIMIGQAAIGNPRIFTPHIPSREEIKDVVLRHLDYMISYENYFQEQKVKYKNILTMPEHLKMNIKNPQAITLAEFRKHLFQYVKGIPGSKEFKQKVATIVDYDQLVEEIQKFFE